LKSRKVSAVRSISGGPSSPATAVDVVGLVVVVVVDVVVVVVVDEVVVVVVAAAVVVVDVEVVVVSEPEQAANSSTQAASSLRLRPVGGVYPFPIGEALCTTSPCNAKHAFALFNISYKRPCYGRSLAFREVPSNGPARRGLAASPSP
jgi:hypothetical protein